MQNNDIFSQLKNVIDHGNEDDLRSFLSNPDNLAKFSPSVQAEIAGAFFEEQLKGAGGEIALVDEFKDQGIKMVHELEGGKRIVEDTIKIKDLEKQLGS